MTKQTSWAPYGLALLRIMSGLVFMQHGLQKMFHFPVAGDHPEMFNAFSMIGVQGLLEVFGGGALVLGLYARGVAFVLCGDMAVAYLLFHLIDGMKKVGGFFPVVNGGDLAIVLCFVFLYIFLAGPGAWSLDARRNRGSQDVSA